MQQIGFFIAKLTVGSTCFGHHYAHHRELKIYTDDCCLWYLVLWFTGRWSGVELWVICPVCRMFLEIHPANRTHVSRETSCKPDTCFSRNILQTGHITLSSTPEQRPVNQSTKYHRQQPSL